MGKSSLTCFRLRVATPRQRDFGFAGLQDNESTVGAAAGITESRIYGIMEASPRQRDLGYARLQDN